jgi:hypothetical protein
MGNSPSTPVFQTSGTPVASFFNSEKNTLASVCKNSIEIFDVSSSTRKILSIIKTWGICCADYIFEEDIIVTGENDGKSRLYSVLHSVRNFNFNPT